MLSDSNMVSHNYFLSLNLSHLFIKRMPTARQGWITQWQAKKTTILRRKEVQVHTRLLWPCKWSIFSNMQKAVGEAAVIHTDHFSLDPSGSSEWFNSQEIPRAIRMCGNSHSRHPQPSKVFTFRRQAWGALEQNTDGEPNASAEGRNISLSIPCTPQVPQTLGHKNNSQITFGNRKHLEHKHLNRIIRHLLFRPFQSISVSCALLENSEEKLLKCSPRPGWDPAAGLCQGCSTQQLTVTSHKGMAPNQRWHIHHCSPLSPLTESPALAGYWDRAP